MSASATETVVNSHSASSLHARLQLGTRRARESSARTVTTKRVRQARIPEATVWRLLDNLHVSASAEPAPARDRALRGVLSALLEGTKRNDRPVQLPPTLAGPILIVRSGPWPLLRALVQELSTHPPVPAVTVLCHRRDNPMLEALARSTGVELIPLNYPRFEPFNPVTLERLLAGDRQWTAAFLLDASRAGTSRSLDHITRTLAPLPGDKFVWNGSGQLFRPLSLLEMLGRERYEIVRRLLRWRARNGE